MNILIHEAMIKYYVHGEEILLAGVVITLVVVGIELLRRK